MLSARTFLPLSKTKQPLWERYLDDNPHVEEMFEEFLPLAESFEIEFNILLEEQRLDERFGSIMRMLGALGIGGVAVGGELTAGMFSRFHDVIANKVSAIAEHYNVPADKLLVNLRDGLMKMVSDLGVPVVTVVAIAKMFGYEWDTIGNMVGVIVVLYIIYQILRKNRTKGKQAAENVVQNKEKVKKNIEQGAGADADKPVAQATEVFQPKMDHYLRSRYGRSREELRESFRQHYGCHGDHRYRRFEQLIMARLMSLG